ncbi:MAG: NADH-quinone oxidoreductase subunit NuoE [Desulfomonile sp.]|nr:NADH-quinone oxidoreductase subunit NuoE [Desulfomonile sp.]
MPLLTDAMKQELQAEIDRSETRKAACIEAMQIVQRHLGWISDESLLEIADFLQMTPDELEGVATFYNHIYRKPVGKYVILICDSVCCWIMGYESLQEHIARTLGIRLGETTADGLFTLLPIQCLGACARAPAIMIRGELYTDLTPERFDEIIASYRREA